MEEKYTLFAFVLVFLLFCALPVFIPETGTLSTNPFVNVLALLHDYTLNYFVPLIPALFMAGALATFVPRGEVLRHLEKPTPRYKVYFWSMVSGILLAVYYSTIFPILAGMKKRKADIGPLMSFLYTASAVNVISVFFIGLVLGWRLAVAYTVFTLVFAFAIGVLMSKLYKEQKNGYRGMFEYFEEITEGRGFREIDELPPHDFWGLVLVLITLALMVLTASLTMSMEMKLLYEAFFFVLLLVQVRSGFSEDEVDYWFYETYMISKSALPFLWIGLFVVGVFSAFAQTGSLAVFFEENGIFSAFGASLIGVLMYFPAATEVPAAQLIIKVGTISGMEVSRTVKGVVLAFLLSAPAISPLDMFLLSRIMGRRKIIAYALMIIASSVLAGVLYALV
jgi:uncharacterized membrane protein YraQ (UPF0718 family)